MFAAVPISRPPITAIGPPAVADKSFCAPRQLVPLVALVVVFGLLNLILLRPWQLSEDSYRQQFILAAAVIELFQPSLRSFVLLAIALFLLTHFRTLAMRWQDLEQATSVRVIVSVAALLLGWMYSTYDFNHYLGRGHTADRVLVALLSLAVVWRPLFVFPFLFVLWPVIGQFNIPLSGYSWAIAFLPARILLLFGTMLLIGFATKSRQTAHFRFVVICLIAGHYFPVGVGKLKIDWMWHDRVYYMLPSTYSAGWLGFLDADSISALTNSLKYMNWPMKAFTMLAECGAIVVLARRFTVISFAAIWMLFHIGIFLVSGFFFWPWIVIQVALLVLALKTPLIERWQYGWAPMLCSLMLIAASAHWVRPVNLSWIDSPVTYRYRITAIGASGKEYSLGPSSMGPYFYQFTLSEFHYLATGPTIRSHGLAPFRRLADVRTPEDVFAAETEIGKSRTQPAKVARFDSFLSTYFRDVNSRSSMNFIPRWARAPKTLWTFSRDPMPTEEIVRIRISQALTAFLEGAYQEIRVRPVLDVNVVDRADRLRTDERHQD